MQKIFDLTGKVAVITGASGAIGSALAKGLTSFGADLALCYGQNTVKALALQESLGQYQRKIKIYPLDIASEESIKNNALRIRQDFGRIDILVNCAGGNIAEALTGGKKTFFDLKTAPMQEVVDLNFFGGCFWPCLYYGRQMLESGQGGSIINITSMNTYRPLEGRPGYSAAKAAVSNFTQWLAVHLAKECSPNLRVNAIAPGFVPNERTMATLVNADGSYAPRGQKIIDHTPMGRLSVPEDLVGTCIWLASQASSYVTGTVTPIDGGFTVYAGL